MELASNTMSREHGAHDVVPSLEDVVNRSRNRAEWLSRRTRGNATLERSLGHTHELAAFLILCGQASVLLGMPVREGSTYDIADEERPGSVAVEAVQVCRYVDVDDVPILQRPSSGAAAMAVATAGMGRRIAVGPRQTRDGSSRGHVAGGRTLQ